MTRRHNDPTAGSAVDSTRSRIRCALDRDYPPFDCRPTNRWEPGTREGYGRHWYEIGPHGHEGKRRPRGTMLLGPMRRGPRLKGERR